MKKIQANATKIPLTAIPESTALDPALKLTFQNGVWTISELRCKSHAEPKVLGPEPKSGSAAYDAFNTFIVDSKDGRTSSALIERLC